ncbi:PIG-L family deacetylase [Vicingus serpentipes]|uniref:PIG-L family deacetylase n=1 Tax=Vicingus serpentipes TaxID=1926625 RepID=A0A5C6RVN4_9FLAO|nr:PIG-L family deacetylase [Vicingus serpentipes]TXB66015.1 PIG-L family deacetylase [Vicingus serpentipes]
MKKIGLIVSLFVVLVGFAQQPKQLSSSEIYQKIQKLNVLGNVLYLAAHPDDENTRFIAYSANEKLYNTAYLSLTRGDGGQNLIGTEIREELGIIRTQELLAARRTDGGQQFFSRANDFGYSKNPEETLEIWDKDKILADVVWVIRKFRPDVIVCRFPTDGGGGHGHHTSSALLGVEAFDLAADKTKYPEQLKYVDVWQPKRIVVNTGRWWNDKISVNDPGVVAEDIGLYNNTLGISYNELAAKSRTMHKSQGFGSTGSRGELIEYFEHLKGEEAKHSLFEGYKTDWTRVKGSEKIESLINELVSNYNVEQPHLSVPQLINLKKEINQINDKFWKEIKLKEIDELIRNCMGIYFEARAQDYLTVPGDSIKVDFEFITRTYSNFKIKKIFSKELNLEMKMDSVLSQNKKIDYNHTFFVPRNIEISQPYWLKEEGTLGTYKVDDQLNIGKPENDSAINFKLVCELDGVEITYQIPLIYKWNDPVKGESYRPFVIVPPVFVNFSEQLQLFSNLNSREIELTIKSNSTNVNTKLKLDTPKGWELSQNSFDIKLAKKGEEQKMKVMLTPSVEAEIGDLKAMLTVNEKTYDKSINEIIYDHIPTQIYMPKAKSKLVFVDLKTKGNKIGYFNGAGDKIPEALTSIGYNVDEILESDLALDNLKQYNAIVVGIRAVNVNDRMEFIMPKLLAYAENGGTLIMQYNTSHRLKTDAFAPYNLKLSRDRVTEEDAEVTFLKPEHPVLNAPNKITKADFEGWVQERGLYFPNEWDEKYDAVLSWHDKNEPAKNGSLLVAKYGKGHYVYTGISFFRELPAAVPGAYRLFVNLISLGNE